MLVEQPRLTGNGLLASLIINSLPGKERKRG